uniref:Uncharacterized protein LOC111120202 n=1 Tax=Crassostrea virginica TaxID=6565 RepID=A0A8B8CLI8_CRAVI|nr:uncharacterized protein LOC111120202 [Crassostrea virginica]
MDFLKELYTQLVGVTQCLVLWTSLISVCLSQPDPNLYTCVPNPGVRPTQPSEPPFPVVPNTFSTKLEAIIADRNQTVSGEEYFDENNNRAALFMLRGDKISKLIFDYNTEELFYVYPIHGQESGPRDKLRPVENLPAVGAIEVNVHTGLLLHWYFRVTFILTSLGFPRPHTHKFRSGRRFLERSYKMAPIATVPPHLRLHGFYDNTRPTYNCTPHFVTCKDRLQLRSVPTLPNAFSYREEIISSVGITSYADVWYDTQYKLLRLDYRPAYGSPPYYSNDSITEVHDYTIGVGYAIDRVMKNCSIIPLQNNSFDASITNLTVAASKQQFILKMKSPQDLFYLDNNFTYTGRMVTFSHKS